MSDKKGSAASRSTSKKSNKKRSKKESLYYKYFRTPLTFVLVALVLLVPLSTVLYSQAVRAVHKMQEVLVIDYSELEVSETRYETYKESKRGMEKAELKPCEKIGVLRCDNCAVNTPVYYGINRVSLRNGAGLSADSRLPSEGGEIGIAANVSTYFKALSNVKEGDIFTFETSGGTYRYTVIETYVSDSADVDFVGEYLVLTTAENSKPFSYFSEKKRYVVAAPVIGEVEE